MIRSMLAALAALLCSSAFADSATLRKIADDIAALKPEYPQLADFSAAAIRPESSAISYQYRTHRSKSGVGWTGGVPNPDPDGVWFYIDVHDAGSNLQIHTQPAMVSPPQCLGEKRVTFLTLQGARTRPLDGAIWGILRKHGVQPCR
jgi:hypothetical protein